ncbi:hypothetical protein MHU86_14924 [Fragilaria crotonensis]|nr:hypothetical protein MHU86_14924 [Fragilaria crotonensis]
MSLEAIDMTQIVLITGRREEALQKVAEEFEGKVFYKVSDSGQAADRVALLQWVQENHPDCNALVNNAGIQRRVDPVSDDASWEERASEIEINVSGPIHLTTLFVPFFLAKPETVCILANVSSGLAFIPFCAGPVYAATKAAIHSYTMSMRYSLQDTNVRVVEIVPLPSRPTWVGLTTLVKNVTNTVRQRWNASLLENPKWATTSPRLRGRQTETHPTR